jgi:hypothetical protein
MQRKIGKSGATIRTISCVSGGSVEDAIALALQAHRGQSYAATDQPFILHPLQVMLRFEGALPLDIKAPVRGAIVQRSAPTPIGGSDRTA